MTMTRPKPVKLKTELESIAERCGELHRSIEGHHEEIRKLLLRAKKAAPKVRGGSGFTKWVRDNKETLGFGLDDAWNYMKDAGHSRRLRKAAHEREIRALAAKTQKAEAELSSFIALAVAPIDYDRTKVALDIVSAGYKAMSLKSHPDVGGTADLQTALTGARDWLVTLINNPLFATGDK